MVQDSSCIFCFGKEQIYMILIAGGAGYIGSHMNKYLHKLGEDTVVFDNLVY